MTPEASAASDEVCGETYDHIIEYVADDEDAEQWVCRRCGAEGWNDYSDPEADR